MPVTGTSSLPVADRGMKWDGPGAKRRVLEACNGNVAGISRAFLWRNPDADPRTAEAWSLGFADMVDGKLTIVPRGIAECAGVRGVVVASIPDELKTTVQARITTVYDRVRSVHTDWPESPFAASVALMAAADPSWFADPGYGDESDSRLVLQDPERPEEERQLGAPLEVSDDGRIQGHAALWGRCHVGYPGSCVKPPREPAAYAGFLTGQAVKGIPTGPLVMKTTHASLRASPEEAAAHYHNTGYAVADVTVGSDAYGIWVAGAIRADASETDVDVLRGSALSGDWRTIGGRMRLVGLLVVNAPGFRVARAMAASAALLTIGPGCDECSEERSLEDRLAILERLMADQLVAGL
jgi:hypothetical protein